MCDARVTATYVISPILVPGTRGVQVLVLQKECNFWLPTFAALFVSGSFWMTGWLLLKPWNVKHLSGYNFRSVAWRTQSTTERKIEQHESAVSSCNISIDRLMHIMRARTPFRLSTILCSLALVQSTQESLVQNHKTFLCLIPKHWTLAMSNRIPSLFAWSGTSQLIEDRLVCL